MTPSQINRLRTNPIIADITQQPGGWCIICHKGSQADALSSALGVQGYRAQRAGKRSVALFRT